jgi:hypothetical protein
MMPFCVSSFAALVKGKGFYLVFSPRPRDLAWGFGLCAAFCAATTTSRALAARSTTLPGGVTTEGETGT